MIESSSDLAPDLHSSGSVDEPAAWPWLGLFGFRIAFCFLLISVASVTSVLTVIPVAGGLVYNVIASFWDRLSVWLGQHIFHLTGLAAHPHSAASRDTALSWIVMGSVGVASLLCGLLWTAVDRRRREYRTAAIWLRFLMRLSLICLMVRYGSFKLFPLQMSPPSLAVLNEPLGDTSQMTLLWTLIALHPAYETICGSIEIAAAILLTFRRTAVLGGLLTIVVMTNVLLYNLFFDVPVKLGAAIILLYALAVIAPDLRSLFQFFWEHRPAAPKHTWAPPFQGRPMQRIVIAAELLFVIFVISSFVPPSARYWNQQLSNLRNPSPLTGEWRVESALITQGGNTFEKPVLTGEGLPMTALFLEPNGQAMARSSDGKLWRAEPEIDLAKRTFTLSSGYFDGERFNAEYEMQRPDAQHLTLVPIGRYALTNATLVLTRVPLPAQYPLLSDGFRWISEYPLER